MSSGEKRPLREAKAIAEAFFNLVKDTVPAGEIMVAGSIRRQKSIVGDIEIVALCDPKLHTRLDELVKAGTIAKGEKWGDRYRAILFQGMKIDLFMYDALNRGAVQLIRTGPGDMNERLMIMLGSKKSPWRFKDRYLYYSHHWEKNQRDEWDADDKKLIPAKDEETLYRYLGMIYVEPENRTEERLVRALSHSSHLWGPCPHVCEIHTARINSDDPATLDITIKSASTDQGRVLAPTWDMVMGHKEGTISDDEYTAQYLELLRARYKSNREIFHSILKRDRVVLTCYCSSDVRLCHRHLAVDVLTKIAAATGVLVVNAGELQPKAKQLEMF